MTEIAIPKVWRSEARLVLLYLITSCMSIYLSYLLPWTIVVEKLFTIGDTQVMLHLPLLWFIPVGFLSTAVFRLYDVSYLIDTDGLEAKVGLLNFRKRIIRVRFEDIRSVKTHQDILGRLFDIGRIEIRTAATSDLEIFLEGVSAPLEIHSMIESEKAQRQHLAGRTAKESSSRLPKKGKVAFIILLANMISLPLNPALAAPDNNGQITSVRDMHQNDSLGKSLRESVSRSTLEGDEDLKLKQDKLQDEEKRLRTAEEKLLKSEDSDKSEKIKPASPKAKNTQPTPVPPAATPTKIPSPQPTIIKSSVATPIPKPRPTVEAHKEVRTEEQTETVKPALPATSSANTPKGPTSVKPGSSGPEDSRLHAENSRLRDEIEALKVKTKTELAEVDDLRVKLMVAETQIERLNRIIEECSQRGDGVSNYRSGAQERTSGDGTSRSMYATVIGNSITPRTGPGNSFAPISSLRRGQRVPVENRQGDWYKVRLPNGAFAWVHSALIKVGGDDDNFDLPGAVPPPDPKPAIPRERIKRPASNPAPVPDERLEDVDKEAFRLLEKLKIERDAESGS